MPKSSGNKGGGNANRGGNRAGGSGKRAATEVQARLVKLAILPDAIVTTPRQNENNDQEWTTLA